MFSVGNGIGWLRSSGGSRVGKRILEGPGMDWMRNAELNVCC